MYPLHRSTGSVSVSNSAIALPVAANCTNGALNEETMVRVRSGNLERKAAVTGSRS